MTYYFELIRDGYTFDSFTGEVEDVATDISKAHGIEYDAIQSALDRIADDLTGQAAWWVADAEVVETKPGGPYHWEVYGKRSSV